MNFIFHMVMSFFFCISAIVAEVHVEEAVNSWDSTGFLWVAIVFGIVICTIIIAVFYEKRAIKRMKNES